MESSGTLYNFSSIYWSELAAYVNLEKFVYDVIVLVTKHPLLLLYHCSLYCVKCFKN